MNNSLNNVRPIFNQLHKNVNPQVIGIVGRAGHGKSSISRFLVENYGYYELTFAEPIKMACMHMFDLSNDQLHDRLCKEKTDIRWGLSPREMFQKLGTDFGRNMIKEDIWIQNLHSRILQQIILKKNVVISDVRFYNEAEFLKTNFNAHIVRVNRPYMKECLNVFSENHESEIAGLSIIADYVIFNNGSLQDLEDSVHKYIKENNDIP